jgi:hypothetical protein
MTNNTPVYLMTLEEMPSTRHSRETVPSDCRQSDTAEQRLLWENVMEQRIADIKAQLRFQVLHDSRVTQKEYLRLIKNTDGSAALLKKLEIEVEAEVEQRYREYLAHLTNMRGEKKSPPKPSAARPDFQKKSNRICALRKLFREFILCRPTEN